MAQQKLWYLVAYDIRESKRLRRVAKHLEGYGTRIQYSIFRCRLTGRQMERLRWELTRVLKPEDSLITIGLCDRCVERIATRGRDDRWSQETSSYKIV